MKIKDIEFDENTLRSYTLNENKYNSVVKSNSIRWTLMLNFEILDDFGFRIKKLKLLEYTEFEFITIQEMTDYIVTVSNRLNVIVHANKGMK